MTRPTRLTRLSRTSAAPPARLVHLGLGAFHRSHQAWYTHAAADGEGWGITAFTGRSGELARQLGAQDGLYHLVVRGAEGDATELIASIVDCRSGSDHAAWTTAIAAPQTSVVTLTVTENAYHYGSSGSLDAGNPDVAADLDRYRRGTTDLVTVPGRLVAGLDARRRADSGPVSVVPCDNLSDNAGVASAVVTGFADRVDPSLAAWIRDHVEFVATMVDRITPATTAELRTTVARATGFDDACPVVTEPFTEWVLSGRFPAGRPEWQSAGAAFVDDVGPFEQRKLRLLNGAHSLLAYAGSALGHTTVASAIGDARCLAWVEKWWRFASPTIDQPAALLAAYTDDLLARFGNARIAHQLAQIAADGSKKIPIRVLPALRAQRIAGSDLTPGVRVVAAWIAHLRGGGSAADVVVRDPESDALIPAAQGAWRSAAAAVLRLVAPDLAEDAGICGLIAEFGTELEALAGLRRPGATRT